MSSLIENFHSLSFFKWLFLLFLFLVTFDFDSNTPIKGEFFKRFLLKLNKGVYGFNTQKSSIDTQIISQNTQGKNWRLVSSIFFLCVDANFLCVEMQNRQKTCFNRQKLSYLLFFYCLKLNKGSCDFDYAKIIFKV